MMSHPGTDSSKSCACGSEWGASVSTVVGPGESTDTLAGHLWLVHRKHFVSSKSCQDRKLVIADKKCVSC